MNLLGIHINTGQTSAALLKDGQVAFAVAEERFDRIKLSRAFPRQSIKFCLAQAGIPRMEDLDGIAISWNPAENMRHINLSGFTQWRRYDPEWLYIVPNNLMAMAGEVAFSGPVLKMELNAGGHCPLYFVNHHHAHLAHAICQSPFERGLAVAVDEYGEFDSVTVATFKGSKMEIIKRIPYPNSLGVFFATFTEYLGFTPNSDEWKVMGAGAYGDPKRFQEILRRILTWDESKGTWTLDTRCVEHANMKRAGYMNDALIDLLGIPPRRSDQELEQVHYDLAAAAQAVFEERIFQLISFYARQTGETDLAAAGGSFMNSLANGKIIANTPIKNIFIPYAAADNGGSVGAALYVQHYLLDHKREIPQVSPTPFLGPEFSNEEIADTLQKFNLPFRQVDHPAAFAAEQIAAGKLVGWFQGRMEFGERALGNRSILADTRDAKMKDKINAAVKYREAFRPFAPAVLAERAHDYFEMPEGVTVPYMEQVYPIRKEHAAKIPAVVHNDGTGRLQTVSMEIAPLFHEVISDYEKITGIPLVLNTSFNVQGEPIVCSPRDAIRTFFACGLDILVMGNNVVVKQ
jgi:carbamoyltransferase